MISFIPQKKGTFHEVKLLDANLTATKRSGEQLVFYGD
jgi:hypothetical protein